MHCAMCGLAFLCVAVSRPRPACLVMHTACSRAFTICGNIAMHASVSAPACLPVLFRYGRPAGVLRMPHHRFCAPFCAYLRTSSTCTHRLPLYTYVSGRSRALGCRALSASAVAPGPRQPVLNTPSCTLCRLGLEYHCGWGNLQLTTQQQLGQFLWMHARHAARGSWSASGRRTCLADGYVQDRPQSQGWLIGIGRRIVHLLQAGFVYATQPCGRHGERNAMRVVQVVHALCRWGSCLTTVHELACGPAS